MNEALSIAVYLDENNNCTSLKNTGTIKVFIKNADRFVCEKELYFDINNVSSIKDLREKFVDIVRHLDGCRIFAASEIKGIPLTILENLNFSIWEVYGTPEEFLDIIYKKEASSSEQSTKSYITQIECGHYFVDLKAVMDKSEKLSSKQLLIPFFEETHFQLLEVACSHIPPWFENGFDKYKLKYDVIKTNSEEFIVSIRPVE